MSYFSVTNHKISNKSDIFYCYLTDNFLDVRVIKCFGISTLLDKSFIISSEWACRFWNPVFKILSINYSRCFWSWLCILENKWIFKFLYILLFKAKLIIFFLKIIFYFLYIKIRKIIIKWVSNFMNMNWNKFWFWINFC